MTGEDLVRQVREDFLDDAEGDESSFLWKTPAILNALSRSQKEVARRTLCIHDAATAAICQINLTISGGEYLREYSLDKRILEIDRIIFPGQMRPMGKSTADFLDQADAGWGAKTGTPAFYIPNLNGKSITLSRQPVTGGTMRLAVRRLPLVDLTLRGEIEIPEYDEVIIFGCLDRLYRKQDAETYDPKTADRWRNEFERGIGQIIDDEAKRNPSEAVMRPDAW